ncbi:MAG: AAA family ATPase, partial [Desulfohalobiaceae bacterium]
MGISIAFSGKGGTGKTTLCGMLIRYMLQKDMAPLLAVDADPNYNLNEVLGVEVEKTLGQVREQMKQGDVPSGMTKDSRPRTSTSKVSRSFQVPLYWTRGGVRPWVPAWFNSSITRSAMRFWSPS